MSEAAGAVHARGFFDHLHRVVTSPVDLVEGGMWGCYFGYSVSCLRDSCQKLHCALALSDQNREKISAVWNARKRVILDGAATVSGASYLFGWADQQKLISLGSFASHLKLFGYIGVSISSSIRLFDDFSEFKQTFCDRVKATTAKEHRAITLKQIELVLNVAMRITFIVWGALGVCNLVLGGPGLQLMFDKAFVASIIALVAKFGYVLFCSPREKATEAPA